MLPMMYVLICRRPLICCALRSFKLTVLPYCCRIVHIRGLRGVDPKGSPFDSRLSSICRDFFPDALALSYHWSFDNLDWTDGSYLQGVAKDVIDNCLIVHKRCGESRDSSVDESLAESLDESLDESQAESPPRAIIFLADYTGSTLVKQV